MKLGLEERFWGIVKEREGLLKKMKRVGEIGRNESDGLKWE